MTKIELVRVSKQFGANLVLDEVSVSVAGGQVLCLLGDNGAGKSTLIKILSGAHQPTSGRVLIDGNEVRMRSPRDGQQLGIQTVYQEVDTFPLMSVSQNFFLGREVTKGRGIARWVDSRRSSRIALEQVRSMGIQGVYDGRQLVGTMSGGERQALAIGRAMYFGARVLILDEPTSALGVKESQVVLQLLDKARGNGVCIIFITHNAHHAMRIGDKFVVLNHGRVADSFGRGERTPTQILSLMAGGEAIDSYDSF